MFGEILVAIDGSRMGKKVLQVALEEAHIWKAKINVIYVVETGLFSSLPMDNTWEVMYSLLEKEGNEALARAKEEATKKGVQITTQMKQGHAGNEILKAAEESHADLVIVGSHGKSDVDRLLLGSVSSFVVANSRASVLVVRS